MVVCRLFFGGSVLALRRVFSSGPASVFRRRLSPAVLGGDRRPAVRAGLSGAKERNGCYKRVTDGLRLYECLRRVKVNSSPPRSELRTEIVPPCIITAFLTIASPSPVPPSLRERPLSMR